MSDDWHDISTAPEGVLVRTKIDDGHGPRNIASLIKRTRIPGETRPMWWTKTEDMYVYYEPTHWQPLTGAKP
jgi:hypothetical protein